MPRPVVSATLAALLIAANANAEVAPVTRELAAKVLAIAEKAKLQYPTSPAQASNRFVIEFNGEFGDISPVIGTLLIRTGLSVGYKTPIQILPARVAAALDKFMPLPSPDDLVNATIVVTVTPTQRGAPNIQRIVVFRGAEEVKPLKDELVPTEFTTAIGAPFTINAGSQVFALDVFRTGPPLKFVFVTDKGTFEKTVPADDLANLR